MLSFSERIRNEAIDKFDNFIIQAIAPSNEEIKGIVEHNRSQIRNFKRLARQSYFHLQPNHIRISRIILQPVQSFPGFGSRIDGEVFAVQQLLHSNWISSPTALSHRINVKHLEEDEIR